MTKMLFCEALSNVCCHCVMCSETVSGHSRDRSNKQNPSLEFICGTKVSANMPTNSTLTKLIAIAIATILKRLENRDNDPFILMSIAGFMLPVNG